MTTTQLQLRRDTTANIDAITPAQGEPIYDVTRKALVLGDGATAGGLCVTPIGPTPWTPSLEGTVTNPTVTSTSSGWYVQLGPLVIAQGTIAVSAISGGSGSIEIAGLPLNSVAGAGSAGAAIVSQLGGFTFHSSSYTQLNLVLPPNDSTLFFEEAGSGVANFASAVSQIGSSFLISFIAIYQAAQPTG